MFQDLIKQRREQLGLTQDALVNKLREHGMEITRGALANWEIGRFPSPFDTVHNILILAQVLEIDLTEIFQISISQLPQREFGKAAQRSALIVESLPPDAQKLALEQLESIQKFFPAK